MRRPGSFLFFTDEEVRLNGILARRLRAQRLTGEPFASAVEAVRALGAVQAQDYAGAKWGLGQRVAGATEAELDALFDAGGLLRVHILRPTWHFVLPDDARWMQELTGRRAAGGLSTQLRRLELDQRTLDRAFEVLGEAVAGSNFLTRVELGEALGAAGIAVDASRLYHLLVAAEYACVLTSGPRRGKQFTWALLAERAPRAAPRERDDALRELAVRYFRTRAPAELTDFAWWSGLAMSDARRGLELAAPDLTDDLSQPESNGLAGHLLPNFDEFTVAYRDRSALIDPGTALDPTLFSYYASPESAVLSNVVTIGGRVRGAWRRTFAGDRARVEIRGLAPFSAGEGAAIAAAAQRFAAFSGRVLELTGL